MQDACSLGDGAIDEEVLPHGSIEACGERIALEPVVDSDTEPVVIREALDLVVPRGGEQECVATGASSTVIIWASLKSGCRSKSG